MIVTFWKDTTPGWRSKWIRLHAQGPACHVSCTVGDMTYHHDRKRQGWYGTPRLYDAYTGSYKAVARYHMKDRRQRPMLVSEDYTWEVLKWKYLRLGAPVICTGSVCKILQANGHDVPIFVDPNHLMDYLHDCNWTIREGAHWKEPVDPRVVLSSRITRVDRAGQAVRWSSEG